MIVEELGVTFPGSINLDGSVQFADILKDGMGFPLCGNQPVSQVSENIVETFVNLNAIEPTRSRGRRRVDGVGRSKFDFHTGR